MISAMHMLSHSAPLLEPPLLEPPVLLGGGAL
jgi:hypothetical protein